MATQLDAVNQCLAIMGEAPLNALVEDHAYKQAALNLLDKQDATIQAKGWWYNTEKLTLRVDPADHRVYLPTDAGTIKPIRGHNYRYVQRGRVLYNLDEGTDRFDDNFTLVVKLVRRLPITDVPQTIGDYIIGATVLDFQNSIDGDSTKTRDLKQKVYGVPGVTLGYAGEAEAEDIRNAGYNFINDNSRLGRIRRATHRFY